MAIDASVVAHTAHTRTWPAPFSCLLDMKSCLVGGTRHVRHFPHRRIDADRKHRKSPHAQTHQPYGLALARRWTSPCRLHRPLWAELRHEAANGGAGRERVAGPVA
jgi:hypothetical protein